MDTGTAINGMIEARQVCRKMITTSTTSTTASMQRRDDLLDRGLHEARRVVDDAVAHAGREVDLELLHRRAHVVRQRQRIRTRRLEDGDGRGFLVVQQAAQRVRAGREFHPPEVAHADQPAGGRVGPHDDVGELFLGRQPALGVHGELELGARASRAVRPRCRQPPARSARGWRSTTSAVVRLRVASLPGSSQMRIA